MTHGEPCSNTCCRWPAVEKCLAACPRPLPQVLGRGFWVSGFPIGFLAPAWLVSFTKRLLAGCVGTEPLFSSWFDGSGGFSLSGPSPGFACG